MTRLFTISFIYREVSLQAMVSIQSSDAGAAYQLKFKPQEINNLFPNGQFDYSGLDGYTKSDEYNIHSIREIIDNAGKAIKEKLIREHQYHLY